MMRTSVLVVDDELDLLDHLASYLSGKGFEVAQASDGIDAVSYLYARRPDIVLVDLMMPRMNGLELIEQIRSDPGLADLDVVAMSGRPPLLLQAQTAGANAVLCKPIDSEALICTLTRRRIAAATDAPRAATDTAISAKDVTRKSHLVAKTELRINASPIRVWNALTTPDVAQKYMVGGHVLVSWDLHREGNGTVVAVAQGGIESKNGLEISEANWNEALRALKKTVEG